MYEIQQIPKTTETNTGLDTTHHVCFPRSPEGFPLQVFLPMTFTATCTVLVQWQLSFSET